MQYRNAGTGLMPAGELAKELEKLFVNGLRSATKNKIIVHTRDAFARDELLIYGSNSQDSDTFYHHVVEMGYDAVISVYVQQKFDNKYITAKTYKYNYTEYRTATINDLHGYAGSISIPEDKTVKIPIPEQNLTYLYTQVIPVLFMVEDGPRAEYKARVDYDIYRQYRGGPVLKVIDNAMKASIRRNKC